MELTLKNFFKKKFYLDEMDNAHYQNVLNNDDDNTLNLYDNEFIEREFTVEFTIKHNGKIYHLLQPLFDIEDVAVGSKFVFFVENINNNYIFNLEKNNKVIDKIAEFYEETKNNFNKNDDTELIC